MNKLSAKTLLSLVALAVAMGLLLFVPAGNDTVLAGMMIRLYTHGA